MLPHVAPCVMAWLRFVRTEVGRERNTLVNGSRPAYRRTNQEASRETETPADTGHAERLGRRRGGCPKPHPPPA